MICCPAYNEHPASLTFELCWIFAFSAQPDLFLADVFAYRLLGRRLLGYPVEVRHLSSKAYRETLPKQSPVHTRLCGIHVTYRLPLLLLLTIESGQISKYLLGIFTVIPHIKACGNFSWNDLLEFQGFRLEPKWAKNGPLNGKEWQFSTTKDNRGRGSN